MILNINGKDIKNPQDSSVSIIPSVSVIVTTHDVASYVDQAILSIRHQSDVSLEVIIVDDASRDATPSLAASHVANDPRVRLVPLRVNGGVCSARNQALDLARGRWIAWVDGDDWIHPQRLATMVQEAEAADLDWLADDQYIVRHPCEPPLERVFRQEVNGLGRIDLAHLITKDPPERIGYGTLKPLIRRDFLERHAIRFRIGQERYEDFLLHVECGIFGARMGLLNLPLYYYRQRSGSLTKAAPIITLVRMLEQNAIAEAQARLHGATHVVSVLARRAYLISQALAYRRLLHKLKQRDLKGAARAIYTSPRLSILLIDRLSRATSRRLGWQV